MNFDKLKKLIENSKRPVVKDIKIRNNISTEN